MDTPKPSLSNAQPSIADHEKPTVRQTMNVEQGAGRLTRAIAWLRRPTAARMPMWKFIISVAFGIPVMLLALLIIVGLMLPKPKTEQDSLPSQHTDRARNTPIEMEVVTPGPWIEPLARYLHVGPKRKASECYDETNHRQCDPSFPGLSLTGVSFLHGHKGAWSVILDVDDSSDFRPGRFGPLVKLCERQGLKGFGAIYYQITGGPLSGAFVTIQHSAEKPNGHQAIIKSPLYFRFAPSRFIDPEWLRCAKQAGIPLSFNSDLD